MGIVVCLIVVDGVEVGRLREKDANVSHSRVQLIVVCLVANNGVGVGGAETDATFIIVCLIVGEVVIVGVTEFNTTTVVTYCVRSDCATGGKREENATKEALYIAVLNGHSGLARHKDAKESRAGPRNAVASAVKCNVIAIDLNCFEYICSEGAGLCTRIPDPD